MTFGDSIRNMADEELAEFLSMNDPECDPPEWCLIEEVPDHKGPLVDALEVINTFPEEFIFTNEQARALTNYIIPAEGGEG